MDRKPQADSDQESDMTTEADTGNEPMTRTVSVVVSESTDGVQKYTARVACTTDGEATVEQVDPGALERFFEVVEGGPKTTFVRARAVDMTGEARHIDDPATLFTVHFTEPVAAASIQLHFETILDHEGETVPAESLRFDAIA